MTEAERFVSQRFPRSSEYHPEWVMAGASGGANALWLTEWLAEALDLRSGMRVLDLGCGNGHLLSLVLAHCPNATGVGLDFSPTMLEQARSRFAGSRSGRRNRRQCGPDRSR